jgi:hypothetical protein
MKTLHNQKGFGMASLIATLIAFGFVGYFIMQMGVEAKKATIYSNSKNFYEQLDVIKEALLAYQSDKIAQGALTTNTFPIGFSDLIGDYLPDCSTVDHNAGKCRPANYTPWGNQIALTRQTQYIPAKGWVPYSRIIITLPPATDAFKFEHDVHVATLLKLPFAKYNESANTITWEVRRVGEELQHDGLVRRSGDNSTLLGDWDVGGNFAITNARDVTIRNSDGSQRSVGAGVIRVFSARHGERIKKHKCPTGLTPDIIVARKAESAQSSANNLNSITQVKAYATSSGSNWIIGLDYYAQLQSNPSWILLHDGEVVAMLTCNQP